MRNINVCDTDRGKIEYSREGIGPTVLIVHGGHDSCRGDFRQQQLIENGFSVLIPTRPGYGGTPRESGKTAESTAALFAALLDMLKIEKVFLIGVSAGGPVALEFAKRYPEKTGKLILEAAVVKPWFHRLTVQYYGAKVIFNPRNQKKFWDGLRTKLQKNERKTLLDNLKLFTRLKPEDVLNRMKNGDIQALKERMVINNDSGTGFIFDIEHRAGDIEKICCSTLIIHSRNDGSVPFSHAEYAADRIKNSELFMAPTDTHFLYIGPGSDKVLEKRINYLLAAE
jgi:pimeloyl-ACP methyl ester carboxylesterase